MCIYISMRECEDSRLDGAGAGGWKRKGRKDSREMLRVYILENDEHVHKRCEASERNARSIRISGKNECDSEVKQRTKSIQKKQMLWNTQKNPAVNRNRNDVRSQFIEKHADRSNG